MAYTTIDNPELYFQVLTWSGNDVGTSRAFTFDGEEDMQPDLVWTKIRTGWAAKHNLWDAVRGVNKNISSDATTTETTTDQYGYVSSFDSDGFTGSNGSNVHNPRYLYNENGGTYVAWCWKANGTGSSNTAGSINTTATSANTTAGISIVTWTGDENSSATLGHGLGAVPKYIVTKGRTYASSWATFHASHGATKWFQGCETDAVADNDQIWNDTEPTSTLFTVGASNQVNDAYNYVAYVFAEKQGFSKFGSYTGNSNADGTFVYTGFRPAMVIVKRTDTTDDWFILDNKRNTYNPQNKYSMQDSSNAEATYIFFDFLSNGFKIRSTGGGHNTGAYIFMAFAEAPFVNSKGVPCNAR